MVLVNTSVHTLRAAVIFCHVFGKAQDLAWTVDHIIAVVILRNVRGITNSQPILSDENFATLR